MTVVHEPPKTFAELNQIVKHNMEPDPAWEETGEFHRDEVGNRYPVYIEKLTVRGRVAKRDVDGEIQYHLAGDGSRRRPMYEDELIGLWCLSAEHLAEIEAGEGELFKGTSDDVRNRLRIKGRFTAEYPKRVADYVTIDTFINVPVGNNICQKVRNFQPSAAEIERKAMDDANRRAMAELQKMGPGVLGKVLDAVKGVMGLPVAAPSVTEPVTPPAPPPAKGKSPKPDPQAADI